ncbi:DUF6565 domain-containing protein [Marinifilum fragile]|uniref:DUF6565 domain-containing protein n=1 Tax=Marinifilum fragile TaxID=570161 RepID=UPI002AA90CB8|nr:DUF6565 domain-containing protein [Marinifilum fragile]
MLDIKAKHEYFSENDWVKVDDKFSKFNGEWKLKFENKFSIKDRIIISKYQVTYNYYRLKIDSIDFLESFQKDDLYNYLKVKIQFYIDNDMSEDLIAITKQAENMGGEVVLTVKQIFEELNVDLEKLQSNISVIRIKERQ